jgi:putative transposase
LQQNTSAYMARKDTLAEVVDDIRTVFNAPDRATAEGYLSKIVQKYEKSASRLADWLEKNLPEGLTVFDFPTAHRRKIRTVNGLERVSKEIKRRTRVVGIFPNEASCLRLVSAILMEIDENWQIGKKYLTVEEENRSPWQSP